MGYGPLVAQKGPCVLYVRENLPLVTKKVEAIGYSSL